MFASLCRLAASREYLQWVSAGVATVPLEKQIPTECKTRPSRMKRANPLLALAWTAYPLAHACETSFLSAHTRHAGVSMAAWCAVVTLLLIPLSYCSAQEFGHTDVLFEYGEEKIEINARTFTSFFPTQGIARQFQSLPGFASETDAGQGILPHDEIVYNVMSDLQFWMDGALRPELINSTQIRVRNRPSTLPDTILSSRSGEQPGSLDPPRNRVGPASETGEFHSDLQWFLESTDDETQPPLGTYAIQLTLTTSRTPTADSDPFYFIWHYGADSDDFDSAVDFFAAALFAPAVPGDLNGDGQLDASDAETLVDAIRNEPPDLRFDLDQDDMLSVSDLQHWVTQIIKTWQGDVDLDGEFSSTDLVAVFQAGKYESPDGAMWRQGDWNADGLFGSSDLVMAFQDGGYENGPRTSVASSVPEPVTSSGTIVGILLLAAGLRAGAGNH